METSCPFCELLHYNDLIISSSEHFVVIYNQAPILPGHVMVIPKEHIERVLDLNQKAQVEMMTLSLDTIKVLLQVFKAKAFNWVIQEGTEAGQTIAHLHMHLIPRKEQDLPDPGDWYPRLKESQNNLLIDSNLRKKHSRDDLKQITAYIKKQM